MILHPSWTISSTAGNWFVLSRLPEKIRLGIHELAMVREQVTPLLLLSDTSVGVVERAAACAMLHSFYTEIEKILKLIAREWDGQVPSSEAWHRELLKQMSTSTATRPAVLSPPLMEILGEFLAFRHLFRGASIVLMRWEKLAPLMAKVDVTYQQTKTEIEAFVQFIEAGVE